MARGAAVLASNLSSATPAPTAPVSWTGGRTALVIIATTFPSTCNLQMQAMDGSTWVNVNAANITANSLASYDLPAGQYRLNLAGGTEAGLYASLIAIPYT